MGEFAFRDPIITVHLLDDGCLLGREHRLYCCYDPGCWAHFHSREGFAESDEERRQRLFDMYSEI